MIADDFAKSRAKPPEFSREDLIHLEALKLAVDSMKVSSETHEIVERAESFAKFLKGPTA